jgi:glycosyltransferase involved in cell wall biosynthesis
MGPLYFANKGTGVPIVQTLHGVFFNNKAIYKQSTSMNALKADYITGLTAETVRDIYKLGINKTKVFQIPNGVDTMKFYFSNKKRSELRKELGISDDVTVLLTVGSLQQRKGQLEFLKLLKNIPEDFNFKYYIVGSGPDEDKIKEFCHIYHMEHKVKIIGYVANTDLYRYYSAADVYIHASFAEGQALSEIEAYATDLKIAVNRTIIGTIVTDTSDAEDYYLFDYQKFDIVGFCEWASKHKYSLKTRCTYDWNKISEIYANMYNKILESK